METPAIPMTIDPGTVTTSSMQVLQSALERKQIVIVDKSRRARLSGTVELPQRVFCGEDKTKQAYQDLWQW
jgi:hypothetical protein